MANASSNPLHSLDELRKRLSDQQAEVAGAFAALGNDLDRLIEQFAQIPQGLPAPTVAAPAQPAAPSGSFEFLREPNDQGGADLQTLILGPELTANASLDGQRQQLLADLTSGSTAALTLCGAIMLFRGANQERMPQLLKDIGEAWYAWSPNSAEADDDLRDELCGWLQRKCMEAGVPNSIELVRPGDRYDVKRHHARQPGVEVTEVAGWVVLRDNGKVYTKAAVSVR
jgi:hypothetical protein